MGDSISVGVVVEGEVTIGDKVWENEGDGLYRWEHGIYFEGESVVRMPLPKPLATYILASIKII